MVDDFYFMKMAIKEAGKGVGRTSPNPAVGAVIVKNGKVIAKGYHKKAGTPHAEINAIHNAKETVEGSTIYVTLEPCSHTGRTGPCCEAIASAGIQRVVVGMTDPNPLVDGKGIGYLKQHNIEVVAGILREECEALNQPFIKYIQRSLPYMVMKAGVSLDGRLNYQSGVSGWITGPQSGRKVHRLRDKYDAILVGAGTVKSDNPSLTTRLTGKKGRDAVRIVLDSKLTTSTRAKVYVQQSKAHTIVFCNTDVQRKRIEAFHELGVEVVQVSHDSDGLNLHQILAEIGKRGLQSVLVEGGGAIHGSFIRKKMYDYAYLFHAPVFAGDKGESLITDVDIGNAAVSPKIVNPHYSKLGDDMLVSGKIVYS